MGTAIAKSHNSEQGFPVRRDRVDGALTILSLAGPRLLRALCVSFPLTLLWAVSPAANTRKPGQPEIRVTELEHRVHDLVNNARLEHNVTALVYDDRLAKVARGHSHDMSVRNFFAHTNPDGQDPTARGK